MKLRLLLSPKLGRTPFMLNLIGVMILAVGLGGAIWIWCAQERLERQASARRKQHPESELLAPEDSRRYARDMEVYYGKGGMLMDKWMRWLEGLTHGKPLAYTMAAASVVVAGGCFFFASVFSPLPHEQELR